MFNKIFLQGSLILILLIFSGTALSMGFAGSGSHSAGYGTSGGELAKSEVTGRESAGTISIGSGLGAAAANYFSVIYEKEYFYRENHSQPIRDYRYYNVKTVVPPGTKKNYVLRDFRREMWENKNYK